MELVLLPETCYTYMNALEVWRFGGICLETVWTCESVENFEELLEQKMQEMKAIGTWNVYSSDELLLSWTEAIIYYPVIQDSEKVTRIQNLFLARSAIHIQVS